MLFPNKRILSKIFFRKTINIDLLIIIAQLYSLKSNNITAKDLYNIILLSSALWPFAIGSLICAVNNLHMSTIERIDGRLKLIYTN